MTEMKMVPVEPTDEMIRAGMAQIDWCRDDQVQGKFNPFQKLNQDGTTYTVGTSPGEDVVDAYRAMLAASPQAPAREGVDEPLVWVQRGAGVDGDPLRATAVLGDMSAEVLLSRGTGLWNARGSHIDGRLGLATQADGRDYAEVALRIRAKERIEAATACLAALTAREEATAEGAGEGPGGWLIQEDDGGWMWTQRRIAATAAFTEGRKVVSLRARTSEPAGGGGHDGWAHRQWLAGKLLDRDLTDDVAYGIVSASPSITPHPAPASADKLRVEYRFRFASDILEGMADGIDGERLGALIRWTKDGKVQPAEQEALVRIFAAPWLAAQDEAEWDGDPDSEAVKDIARITAEAAALNEEVKRHLRTQAPDSWRPIAEHDNSADEVLVRVEGKKLPVVAWRHHPSSRTDIWLTVPGRYQVKPTEFHPLPALRPQTAESGK